MSSNLRIGNNTKGYVTLDEFYKSLMFQYLMDNYNKYERDVMLVIFRKTLHFEKWEDRLSMNWLRTSVGISDNTLRATIKRLEAKNLIEIKRSQGGKCNSEKKYNKFSLSMYIIDAVYAKWLEIKDDNMFEVKYDDY